MLVYLGSGIFPRNILTSTPHQIPHGPWISSLIGVGLVNVNKKLYGKIHHLSYFVMGKSTISIGHGFHSFLLTFTRCYIVALGLPSCSSTKSSWDRLHLAPPACESQGSYRRPHAWDTAASHRKHLEVRSLQNWDSGVFKHIPVSIYDPYWYTTYMTMVYSWLKPMSINVYTWVIQLFLDSTRCCRPRTNWGAHARSYRGSNTIGPFILWYTQQTLHLPTKTDMLSHFYQMSMATLCVLPNMKPPTAPQIVALLPRPSKLA